MPSISYKTKWQEASKNLDRLAAEIDKMRTEAAHLKAEIIRLTVLLEADPEVRRAKAQQQAGQVVNLAGIAQHMKVSRSTPQQWRQREYLEFPPVDFPDIKEPLWYASTIRKWARLKQRVWYDDPSEDVGGEELSPAA